MIETVELTPEDIYGILTNMIANANCEKCQKDAEEMILCDDSAILSCKDCVPEFTKRWQEINLTEQFPQIEEEIKQEESPQDRWRGMR